MGDGAKKKAKRAEKKHKPEPTPAEQVAAAKDAAFKDETPAKAFQHFRPLAEAVPTADLAPFTGQPLLMRANVLTTLAAVEPHFEVAVTALREPSLKEMFELPSLVMALEFASSRVPIAKLSTGEIERMLSEGAPWREIMLKYLEVASHPLLGLLPRERVAAIRTGSGKLDQAQDFVALPGLFAEFAQSLAGKHPFPSDKLDLMATLGGTLVQHVKPGNAPTVIAKRSSESILRDQFASLVIDRYDRLLVIAAVALGRRNAERLPALRSSASTSTQAPEPEAEPAAP